MSQKMHLISAVIAAFFANSALAWEHEFTRGLDLYSTTDNDATIRLICDPNRVYGGTESMVLIVLSGESDMNADATLAFPEGPTISARLVHGRLSKRDLADSVWQPLINGLSDKPRVELTVNDDTRIVDLGESVAFSCI